MKPFHHYCALILALLAPAAARAEKRAIRVEDLLGVAGIADPKVSPDGAWVVYTVSRIEGGKTNSDLYASPTAGGAAKRLTTHPGADNEPSWRPDGKSIVFVSDRSGSAQLWILPFSGGEAHRLTSLPVDVSGPVCAASGNLIVFAASAYPGKTLEQTAAIDKEKSEAKSKSKTFDRLMIRHWTQWDDGKKSRLFAVDADTERVRDLTPDWPANVPPAPFGGADQYALSPDGKELAFCSEPLADQAVSTNTDLWTLDLADPSAKPLNATSANVAADAQPAYSPDGKFLAFTSQKRAGFESDRWTLKARDRATGQTVDVTERLDRPVVAYHWGLSSESLLATIDDDATEPIVELKLDRARDGAPATARGFERGKPLISGAANGAAQPLPSGGCLFTRHSANAPIELFVSSTTPAGPKPLTSFNAALAAELDLQPAERFRFEGAGGTEVGGILIKPPGFDPKKKYPLVFLIHGGPQGAWHDEWHNRWNYAMFTAPGYVGVAINPRGSTGYGQEFTDQISRDWTGRVYEDLMRGLDHAIKTHPFIDGDRVAALGGSYGGFMVNWIAGHTDRFKALVSHAGVFDLNSMYFTTEELWFPEWEFGGPPWKNPTIYRDQSPSHFVERMKTPTLVIHGALDFRVPEAQGLGMFTALQRQNTPSRLLYFPDEGHWIAKPANRIVWWNEVHAWLAKHL